MSSVAEVLEPIAAWTILFIDDGSRDNSWDRVISEMRRDPRITAVRLSRNFGKEAALTAGLDVADADCVVVMDVDLQDPPSLIVPMLMSWRAGNDVVLATRKSRATDGHLKRYTAFFFYRIFNLLSTTPIPINAGDFRLMDRRVVHVLRLMPESSRFMKGLFAWVGFQVDSVSFDRPKRSHGKSKFPLWRLWLFALDGIFNFTSKPLRIWAYLGASIVVIGLAFASVVVLQVLLYGTQVPGYASIAILLTLFSGTQIVGIGVIGEYLSRIFMESKTRPLYVVQNSTVQPNDETLLNVGSFRSELKTFHGSELKALD